MKCVCGTKMKKKKIEMYGIKVVGYVCPSCGEKWLSGKESLKLHQHYMRALEVKRTLTPHKNEWLLRIPEKLAKLIGITKKAREVVLHLKGKKLIVESA